MTLIVRRDTIAEQSAELLRNRMLSGELRPGDPVTEEAMAREIGISRPTMREVMSTLVVEGLLTRNPTTRVLNVKSVTAQEIRESYIARRLIELAAVDAAEHAGPAAITAIEKATATLLDAVASADGAAVIKADIDVHLATVALLGSADLVEFYGRLLTKLELGMAATMRSEEELADTAHVHTEFVSLLRARRFADAHEQLRARLERAEEELIELTTGDKK